MEGNNGNFKGFIDVSVQTWKTIFSISNSIDIKKPLTTKILSNPNHEFVKTLLYIYSMEAFVFKEINKASRHKDKSKIHFYGPYASALGFIIHAANAKKKDKLAKKFTVYRGLKLSQEEISNTFNSESPINLLGFTSSTLDKERALSFTLNHPNPKADVPDKTPVLVIIEFTGKH